MNFNYYYNNVPDEGQSRNNLVYTSLISDDQKVFVKWYHNDTEYHQGKNQVVDPGLMNEKWEREVKYLKLMHGAYNNLVPKILDIDYTYKKIYLEIDGPDFWQRSLDSLCDFNSVVSDWQEQMLAIIKAHKTLGLYKHSLHPSSYFVVNGKLKSINYFFTYSDSDLDISIASVQSHISEQRQTELKKYTDSRTIDWNKTYPHKFIQQLGFDCFSNMYPADFIEKAKAIYS